jgi:hypothetical protein
VYKTIVRADRVNTPKCIQGGCNCHNFPYLPNYFAVNSRKMHVRSILRSEICTETIQINHYRARDEEFFKTRKIQRLKDWGKKHGENIIKQLNTDFHQVESDTILRFIPALKERIKQANRLDEEKSS